MADPYFTVAELRAMDDEYADTTEYPDATLEEVRDSVEEDFEEEGHCAFVTRTATVTVSGTGQDKIFLPHPMVQSVTAVSIDGTDLTADELAEIVINDYTLYREDGWDEGYHNISVTYTHGYETIPAAIKRRALKVASDRLVPSQLPSNATSQVVDGINYRIALTNERNPFGDPDIIATIHRYGRSGAFIG